MVSTDGFRHLGDHRIQSRGLMEEWGGDTFFKKIDFYIFWPQWVFAVARGLALVAVRRLLTEWPLLLWSTGCRQVGFRSCSSQALECRFSSCGARAQLPCGM